MHGPVGFPKILGTATLNEKGQLVIPVDVRNHLGLSSGSKLVIMSTSHGHSLILIKAEEVEAMIKGMTDALQTPPASYEDE